MAARKRTEITIETDRVVIIRRRGGRRAWCPECGCEVDIVGLGEAEALTGMTGRALRDGAERREWHGAQDRDGVLRLCLESLRKAM